jgi:WS/DGAT/MGAT family acyltransferase
MSDAEGLMWRLDKDPHLSSTFANVSVLDRSPDFEKFVRRLERATIVFERLRQRVQPAPVNLTAPVWVDDAAFDIRYHVRHIALPKPGSMRQLLDYATLMTLDPFERTRPLWQFVVVDGLRGGKSALIQKMHHTIVDGEGGVQLSLEFLDFERDAPEPAVPPLATDPDEVAHLDRSLSVPDVVRDLMAGSMRLPLGIIRQVRDMLGDPSSIPTAGTAAAETVRGIAAQLGDTDRGHSPLWTERSLKRRMEVLRAPFRDTKDAAKRLGGSLNTAFLTAAADAAGQYHVEMGQPVDQLRASMAISTRTSSSGANAFSLARMLVPTGEMPIRDRFVAIDAATHAARDSSATASLETLAAVAATLPTTLVTRLARQQAQTIDFATSNVRGSPVPVFVAGAQLLENYPVGPLAGVAYNLTLLSYSNSLDMGVNIDTAAVTDPELLSRCLGDSFKALLTA